MNKPVPFAIPLVVLCVVAAVFAFNIAHSVVLAVVMMLLAFVLPASLRMANQWERAVVLRLGRFHSLKGPGLFVIIPFVDSVTVVIDQRIQTAEMRAEKALTKDTVSVNVDAIVFWQVHDAQKAALEIADFNQAIGRVAQTSLREMIGSNDLATILSDRKTADEVLRRSITEKTTKWGIDVTSVEIKDVAIPPELENAMSRQAQAERERQARVTLASAEEDIAQRTVNAANLYEQHPVALQIRQMGLVYEMGQNSNTILIPTDIAGSFSSAAIATALAASRGVNVRRTASGIPPSRSRLPRVGK
jgi:regulator of protease activity HflC (stomatin/prohibitin superfamily)